MLRLAADTADTWSEHCASCHSADGTGKTKAGQKFGAKDLTDATYQKSFTDAKAFTDTKDGLVIDGKTKMKPFKDKLTDDEIKALVAYSRTLCK